MFWGHHKQPYSSQVSLPAGECTCWCCCIRLVRWTFICGFLSCTRKVCIHSACLHRQHDPGFIESLRDFTFKMVLRVSLQYFVHPPLIDLHGIWRPPYGIALLCLHGKCNILIHFTRYNTHVYTRYLDHGVLSGAFDVVADRLYDTAVTSCTNSRTPTQITWAYMTKEDMTSRSTTYKDHLSKKRATLSKNCEYFFRSIYR